MLEASSGAAADEYLIFLSGFPERSAMRRETDRWASPNRQYHVTQTSRAGLLTNLRTSIWASGQPPGRR